MKAHLTTISLGLHLFLGLSPLGAAEEYEIELSDPFQSQWPRYLKAPPESAFDSWTYIIRINEYNHLRTPIMTEIRAAESETRITTIRLVGDRIDLSYSITFEHESDKTRTLPEWVDALGETDDVSGLDETSTGVEVFTRNKSKFIARWERNRNEKERGLTRMNRWIEFHSRYSGIIPRRYLPNEINPRHREQSTH